MYRVKSWTYEIVSEILQVCIYLHNTHIFNFSKRNPRKWFENAFKLHIHEGMH